MECYNNPQAVKRRTDAIALARNCSANTFRAIQIAFQSYFYHDTHRKENLFWVKCFWLYALDLGKRTKVQSTRSKVQGERTRLQGPKLLQVMNNHHGFLLLVVMLLVINNQQLQLHRKIVLF